MGKRRNFRYIVPVVFVIFLNLSQGFSLTRGFSVTLIRGREYIALRQVIAGFHFDDSFDIISQKGKLYYKNHYAVFNVGLSAMLIDGRLFKSYDPVTRKDGEVMVPADAVTSILESFFPGIELTRKGELYYCTLQRDDTNEGDPITKPDPARDERDKISFIIIDPGHGGKDPGAVGKGGLKEKQITLKIAQMLEKKLRSRFKDIKIRMTRASDKFIELSRRTEIANAMLRKNENGLFVSIHVNSSISKKISGFETYFLSQNPTNEDARNTAALENNVIILEENSGSGGKKHGDIDYIEAMMLTTQIQKESAALADSIQKGLARNNKVFKSRGVRKADFFVLRGALMPAVLVETGFITHQKESDYITRQSHQEAISEGIADGIKMFIDKYKSLMKVK